MAKKIRGITVQLGGDTSGLTKALSAADKSLAATQRELNEVQKGLKLDPTNVTLMAQKQELLTKAISDTKDKLKALTDNQEKAKRAFEANAEWERKYAPLKESIDKAKESLAKLKKEQEEAEKKFKAGTISADDYEKVKANVKDAEKALADLNKQKADLDKQFADGHITAEEYRAYQREVENTRNELNAFQRELAGVPVTSQEVQKQLSDFGDHAKETFKGIVKAAAAITAALLAVGKQAVETGAEFDSSMSQVAATLGYSAEEINTEGTAANKTFKQLRQFAQDMGKSTAFSATQAGDALNYMALAGYDAEKSMKMLPQVLDLASAGGIELASASDMVTDAQSALGLSIEDTEKLIDRMAKTSSRTNTSVGQLGEGILTIGATAKDMKGGTVELAETLGILADNGIKGAEGGTKLRNILLKLEAPTDKAAAKLEELGVKAYDSDGKLRSMQDIFGDLNNAMAGMTERDKSLAKATIFNARDLGAVNALLNTSVQRWDDLGSEIENSAGAAHDMAEVQLDNLAGDVTLFKSALEGAEITLLDSLNPTLRKTVQFGTEMMSRLADGFGSGGLSGAVEQAHKVIAEQLGEDAKLIYGVETAVEAATAAFITYKATMLLSEGIAALKAVNTLLAEGKTLTEALNAAQMANPYVLIATLAIGAGIAIKKLIDIQTDLIDETADSYDLLDEKQKEAVDNARAVAESIGKSRSEWNKERESIEKQADTYRGLADELYRLDSQQEISVKDRAAMKAITDKLNSSIKGLNIQLDEQTGHLKTQRQTIDDIINGYEEQAKAAAAQSRLTELYEQQIEAERVHKDVTDEMAEAEAKLISLQEQRNEAARAYNAFMAERGNGLVASESELDMQTRLRDRLNEATQAVSEQNDRLGLLRATYAGTGSDLRGVQEDIEGTKNIIGEMGGAMDDTGNKFTGAADIIASKAEQMGQSIAEGFDIEEEVNNAVSEIDRIIKEYDDKLASRTGTLQSWFDVNATVSGEDASFNSLSNALDTQISKMDKWADDIAELEKRGINQNFLDKLKDAGPASQEYVSALLSVSPEQSKAYADKWDEAYQGAAEVAEKQLERMKTDTETQISEMLKGLSEMSPEFKAAFGELADFAVDGYLERIKERMPEMKEFGKTAFGEETMEGYREATLTESPSKKWAELGGYAVEGYEKGIEDNLTKAVKAAKKMADEAMTAAGAGKATAPALSLESVKNVNRDLGNALNAAGQAAAGAQAAATDTTAITKAIKESFEELASGNATFPTTIDSDVIASKTYRKIDILIGRDTTLRRGGYAT